MRSFKSFYVIDIKLRIFPCSRYVVISQCQKI